jgi:hypothetical protein
MRTSSFQSKSLEGEDTTRSSQWLFWSENLMSIAGPESLANVSMSFLNSGYVWLRPHGGHPSTHYPGPREVNECTTKLRVKLPWSHTNETGFKTIGSGKADTGVTLFSAFVLMDESWDRSYITWLFDSRFMPQKVKWEKDREQEM